MAQGHLDRLSGLDASFLVNESAVSHMHVGAVMILSGPAPSNEELREHMSSRLHLVPRLRQRLSSPEPTWTGRPLWIDDEDFDLGWHLHRAQLPEPGTERQLCRLIAEVFVRKLDRSRPLWEAWAIRGLSDDRFAVLIKTHHAMLDGVSGVDLATVLFDHEPDPPAPGPVPDWTPQPPPAGISLAERDAGDVARLSVAAARRAARAIEHPRRTAEHAAQLAGAVGTIARELGDPATPLPFNVPIGPDRRLALVRADLEQFRMISNRLGGTVNDVALTVVAGGIRHWLEGRDIDPGGIVARAQVPVSTRVEDEHGNLGNRLSTLRASLPIGEGDEDERLRAISASMQRAKGSGQATGAGALVRIGDLAPPILLAAAAKLNYSTRLFNLIITNVPGPPETLYLRGRRMHDLIPIGFLPPNQALFVAIMSYDGAIGFSLLADHDAMEDVEVIALGIERSIGELAQIAELSDIDANPTTEKTT